MGKPSAVFAQEPDASSIVGEHSLAGQPEADTQLRRYIPKELQTKLNSALASGQMVGERRVVTMLFCDVQGSTSAAEQMDPEEWSEIIDGAFEYMIRPVYRYEGMVARLMGDAILAFFGAPIAHEDDPQRAILAGLDIVAGIQPYRKQIRERFGLDFDVRVGINTGLVVVGAVGSDLRMEYTALGDAINLASRMEQAAQPGTVLVAQDTYKLAKSWFEFEELGPVEVKGKNEPVLAYRVLSRKAQTGFQRGIEGLHADIVGRQAELQLLKDILAGLKQGVGRILCMIGEAGLGKSRLVHEARKIYLEEIELPSSSWIETLSLSYENSQAYGLFQRLIRQATGITDKDSPPAVREKLAALTPDSPEGRLSPGIRVFEVLFGLENSNGGLPLEGETFKRELLEAVQAWWRNRFQGNPTVLVFDDIHWADSASIELLLQLLPITAEMPLVLLCVMREERQAPAWSIKTTADEEYHHRFTEMVLHPLSKDESNELLNRLLSFPDLPDPLRENILAKSDGNPYYIEEVVRTLIEHGVLTSETQGIDGKTVRVWRATREGTDFDIPNNLQSLLSSRLDRLEESTRNTLQMASVIGRTFYYRVLQAVDETTQELDKRVGVLLRMEMIREAARMPEVEYAFRNPLTQEAVYQTILLKRRRHFHKRVGEAIETLYSDRLERMHSLLAHHFALAGMREKAIEYSRKASQQAVALFAYEDAVQNLRTALHFIEPGKMVETHRILLEEMGDIYRLLRDGENAITSYQQALDLAGDASDEEKSAVLRLHRKVLQVVTDKKWAVSLEYLQKMDGIRQASREILVNNLPTSSSELAGAETVRALVALSTDAWRIENPPDWETAHQFAQAAVQMASQLDNPVDESQALGALANVLDGRSLLREHLDVAQQRLALLPSFDRTDFLESIEAMRCVGAAHMYVGEYDQALTILREAEELAEQAHVVDQQVNTIGLHAQCWFRLDRWDDVLALEEKWRDLERRFSRERIGETCFNTALRASIFALRGQSDRANAYTEEAFDFMVAVSGQPDVWQRNQFY